MKQFRFFLILASLLSALTLSAQQVDDLIYTVTTPVEVDGVPYVYLVWTPGGLQRTADFEWSLHAKPGGADSLAPYQLLGKTRMQTSPATVMSLLRLGASFDADGDSMRERIETLFADATSQSGADAASLQLETDRLNSGETEPTLDTAHKLILLSEVALEDASTANNLLVLGRTHPGVMLAIGHAYLVRAQPGVTTYELRTQSMTGSDRVVGRVTYDAAALHDLPAPTTLTRIFHADSRVPYAAISPQDHLNARFLWATPDALREVFTRTNGFNIYRVPEAEAQSQGWTVAAPLAEDLLTAVSAGLAVQVNRTSIFAAPLLDAADLTDETPEDFAYFADDNRNVSDEPFANGDTFYYYVAARDLAGHPGLISQGLRVVICDRLPPAAPEIIRIENDYTPPAAAVDLEGFAGAQSLAVLFRQTPPDEDATNPQPVRYLIYRWEGPEGYLAASADPEDPAHFVGSVAHQPGEVFGRFVDNGDGSPALPADEGEFYWYTVRVEESACGGAGNLSPHSPPSAGALRDRVGPDAPTGSISVVRVNPKAFAIDDTVKALPEGAQPTPGATNFLTSVQQLDEGIRGYEMTLSATVGAGTEPSEVVLEHFTHLFGEQDTDLRLWPHGDVNNLRINVVPIGVNGRRGETAETFYANVPNPAQDLHSANFIAFTEELQLPRDPADPVSDVPVSAQIGRTLTLFPALGSGKWKLYRRVGVDAQLELVDFGVWDLVSPVQWEDLDMPPEDGVEVCYYGQTFDENENPSVLTLIGCTTIRQNGSALPVPLLADPVPMGTDPTGTLETVRLEWFCDPVGVDRFEILVRAEPAGEVLTGPRLSHRLAGSVSVGEDGEEVAFDRYQSPGVEGSFGSGGAEFSLELNLPVDASYRFAVRAVGQGALDDRPAGGPSNQVMHAFVLPPEGLEPVIPWPQRPLGGVTGIERAVPGYLKGSGPFHAMILPEGPSMTGIFIGTVPGAADYATVQFGPESIVQVEYDALYGPPLNLLFDLTPGEQAAPESLGPFMVYRYQVPSLRFPDAVPNLTQVSPLIDRLAYEPVSNVFIRLHDPWVHPMPWNTAGLVVPLSGTHAAGAAATTGPVPGVDLLRPPYLRGSGGGLFFTDRLPVTLGATYRYLIVRFFAENGEIRGVFPTNPVTITP